MKQTAVEWLVEKIHSDEYQQAFGQTYISPVIIDEAKQMEKQQIEKANKCGLKDGYLYANGKEWKFDTPDQYYNETFKSE